MNRDNGPKAGMRPGSQWPVLGARWALGRVALSCLLSLAMVPAVVAQSVQVQRFTEADGLPNSEVLAVAQGPDGVLWLTTRVGLVSFDGHEFVEYPAPDPALAQEVSYLLIDEQGLHYRVRHALWRGVALGLPGDEVKIPAPAAVSREARVVEAILLPGADGPQLVLATRDDGVWFWSEAAGWRGSHTGLPKGLWTMAVADGVLHVAGDGGLAWLDGDQWRPFEVSLPGAVLGLAVDSDDQQRVLWCVGNDWLGVVRGGQFEKLIDLPDLGLADRAQRQSRGVLTLLDGGGGLWFGNAVSLVRYDGRARALRTSGGPEVWADVSGATGLLRDRDGNVWIGNLRGLSRVSSLRFENWRASHGLLENEVTALLMRTPEQLLLGHNNGISVIEDGVASVLAVFGGATSRPNESRVLDLAMGREGRVWMACTYFGLVSLEADGSVRRHVLGDAAMQMVSAVAVDPSGQIWVGTSTGLWAGDGEHFAPVTDAGVPGKQGVRSLAVLGDDELWVATYSAGVLVHESGRWRVVRHGQDAPWNDIYSVHRERATGQTLLGTKAGLAVAQGGQIVPLERPGLELRQPVYLIFEDDHQLWIGTHQGVISWDGQSARRYTVQQGLAGNETNRAAGCVDAMGCTWFGTVHGASCYRIEHDKVVLRAPSLRLAGVDVAGQEHPLDAPLELEHDSNDLVFSLKAVSFAESHEVLYECRLDGFDDDWLPSSVVPNGRIRYTRLPPGTYRLLARAKTEGGPWSETVESAPIVVLRPWWTEWWANLLLGLALCGLGSGVALLVVAQRRNRRLTELVDERTRALRAAEERYRGMFDKNLAAQLLVDGSAGAILAVNQAAEEHFGQTSAELVGTVFGDMFADDEGLLRKSLESLVPGEPLRQSAQQLLGADTRYVEVHACTYELQGRPLMHATLFDVTDHHQVEEQLRQAQRMESVGRLAGGVAHDFNNLLTAVLGHAEMARINLEDKDSLAEHLDVVASAAVRGAKLTSQLLGFARQQPSAPKRLDLDALLRTLDPVLHGLLREDIELRVELDASGVGVLIDPGQLEQVLLNLVVNSVDAMPKGGVITLSTRRIPAALTAHLRRPAPGAWGGHGRSGVLDVPDLSGRALVCLSVQDTGAGMNAETRARIFEPFFTTKGVGEGTGLGLAMCDGIVRQNGGRLLVESATGEGTRFEVFLPAHEGPVEQTAVINVEPPRSGAETILLVEDDKAVRDVACRTLMRLDYRVLQAADGQAALELVRAHQGGIDLLVTDVIMPHLGGPDLARRLCQQQPDLAVLFMSGYTANALDSQGLSFEDIDLLEKPFHTEELARRVRASLDRRNSLNGDVLI